MPAIRSPRLEVIQELRTRTPTFFVSTFPPGIIGPCFQILEVTASDGSINKQAVMSLPAMVTGLATGASFAVGGKRVRVRVNKADDIEVLLPGTAGQSIPVATVVSKLNEGFAGYLVFSNASNYIRVKTSTTGDSSSLQFLLPSADSAHTLLGFNTYEGRIYTGTGDYDNHPILFPFQSLPDPRSLGDYLTFDANEVTIYRQAGSTPVALSNKGCINWNRQNRLGLAYDVNNGSGVNSSTLHAFRGPEFFLPCGHVIDAAATLLSSCRSTRQLISGSQASVDVDPLNQYLYPYPVSGSATSKLLAIGRHAFSDLILGETCVGADYYHFEAFGFQKWAADPFAAVGKAPGVFGNSVHVKFQAPAAQYADDGIILLDAGPPKEVRLSSATIHGTGAFVAGDVGKYAYLRSAAVPTNVGTYLIASIDALGAYAVLTDPNSVLLNDLVGSLSFCLPPDASTTLPQIAVSKDVNNKVEVLVTYATTSTKGIQALSEFAAALQVSVAAEEYLGAAVGVSYLGVGATGTQRMGYFLNGKDYFLNFGADPVNFGTQEAVSGYASFQGEAALVTDGYNLTQLVGKTLVMRINGGFEKEHTFVSGDVVSAATLATALNTAFGITAVFLAEEAPGPGVCFVDSSGTGANDGVNWVLTDSGLDLAALGISKDMYVWVYGDNVPGDEKGVLAKALLNAVGNTVTLAGVNLGAIAVSYKVLVPGGDVGEVPKASRTMRVQLSSNDSAEAYAGMDSSVEFGGTAIPYLFGPSLLHPTSASDYIRIFRGDPMRILAGDKLCENGILVGTVASVSNYTWDPGLGIALKTLTGAYVNLTAKEATVGTPLVTWYVSAQGISADENAHYTGAATDKPLPEIVVDAAGQTILLKGGLARNSDGIEVQGVVSMPLLAGYRALRRDVTAKGSSPAVQLFNTYDELNTLLGPITPRNPLALGLYFAQLNSRFGDATIQVKGVGVDEISVNMPSGTLAAYIRALALAGTSRMYTVAAMSDSAAVHDLLHAHVTQMSSVTGGQERITYVCENQPTEEAPSLIGSDVAASMQNLNVPAGTFEVIISATTGFNITTALTGKTNSVGNPVPTFGSVSIPEGLYIRRSGDPFRYSVSEIKTGNILKLRTDGFTPGQGPGASGNDDSYYSSKAPTADDEHPAWDVDGEVVSLYIRQSSVDTTTPTGKNKVLEALGALAQRFQDRRVRFVQPASAAYNYAGLDTSLHGYYMTAGLAGRNAARPPQEPFNSAPLAGFTGVQGSSDTFTPEELDTGAGSGIWWMVQDAPGGAVYTRHQLTTDVSSNETKEASVTHALDYCSERVRLTLRGLAGKFNIDPNFLAYLSMAAGTICSSLSGKVVKSCILGGIFIDSIEPDTINVELMIKPWSVANYIRVRLIA